MNAPVQCPHCDYLIPVPVEEMVAQGYSMDGEGEISLLTTPPTAQAHMDTHTEAEKAR